jgi:hypothetical protein
MAAGWGRAGLLAGLVVALYAPALEFGLIWDDPRWYAQGAGLPAWQLFAPLPTYQFYRPLTLLLNRQLISPAGAPTVNAVLAHALQIGAHLAAVLLFTPVLRGFGVPRVPARLAALVFALFPLAHQAVAWQAPQQPLTMAGVLLALLCAQRAYSGRPATWLALSAGVYALALLVQESALPFAFAFVWLAVDRWLGGGRPRWHWTVGWPLLHLGAAGLYALLWLSAPRLAGVTGAGFEPLVLVYLLQAVVYPLAGLFEWAGWSPLALGLVFGLAAALLVLAVARWTARRLALFGLAWTLAGLLPIWAGLSWDYVSTGARLVYPAGLGIALLWAGAMAWAGAAAPWWRRALGAGLLVYVLALSLAQIVQLQQLYLTGTRHLARASAVLAVQPDQRVGFVNFPDRLALDPPPYPLGFWGLWLAPVVQDLADYARASAGRSAADRSLSVFPAGAADRDAWPYRVNLRGADSGPDEVLAAAAWADAVYLTDYAPGGQLELRLVGEASLPPAAPASDPLALFGAGEAVVRLLAAEVAAPEAAGRPARLRLVWDAPQPLPGDVTIFVHLWRAGDYWSDADGDSLGGLLPLWAWQPGLAITDWRPLQPQPPRPGQYAVRVGLYGRSDGQRWLARTAAGEPLPENEVPIGTLSLP